MNICFNEHKKTKNVFPVVTLECGPMVPPDKPHTPGSVAARTHAHVVRHGAVDTCNIGSEWSVGGIVRTGKIDDCMHAATGLHLLLPFSSPSNPHLSFRLLPSSSCARRPAGQPSYVLIPTTRSVRVFMYACVRVTTHGGVIHVASRSNFAQRGGACSADRDSRSLTMSVMVLHADPHICDRASVHVCPTCMSFVRTSACCSIPGRDRRVLPARFLIATDSAEKWRRRRREEAGVAVANFAPWNLDLCCRSQAN
jgi:hypothetical protein